MCIWCTQTWSKHMNFAFFCIFRFSTNQGATNLGTGYWVLGTGYWVLGTGYWVLGTGYWVLGTGYWVLGTGYWVLGTGYWVLGTGYWVLGTGYWVLGTGYWVLGTGYWVLGTGYWVLGTKRRQLDSSEGGGYGEDKVCKCLTFSYLCRCKQHTQWFAAFYFLVCFLFFESKVCEPYYIMIQCNEAETASLRPLKINVQTWHLLMFRCASTTRLNIFNLPHLR